MLWDVKNAEKYYINLIQLHPNDPDQYKNLAKFSLRVGHQT